MLIVTAMDAIYFKFRYSLAITPFLTVPKCGDTSRQERFLLVFGAIQIAAAARRGQQAFVMQLMKPIDVVALVRSLADTRIRPPSCGRVF